MTSNGTPEFSFHYFYSDKQLISRRVVEYFHLKNKSTFIYIFVETLCIILAKTWYNITNPYIWPRYRFSEHFFPQICPLCSHDISKKMPSFVVFIMVKLTLKSELSNKLTSLFRNRNNIQFDVFKSAIGKCSIPLVGKKIIPIPCKYYLVIGRVWFGN